MAAPADVTPRAADLAALITQINNLTESFRLLTAKLDADAGVTDTDYAADITDDAIATAPEVIDTVYG